MTQVEASSQQKSATEDHVASKFTTKFCSPFGLANRVMSEPKTVME
jgi:hypothetical protein